jgi:hypothetical protein
MPRTIFPQHTEIRLSPINKSSNLKKTDYVVCGIAVSKVSRHLDRIQFSVFNKINVYRMIEETFREVFEYLGTNKPKKDRIVNKFRFGDITLHLIRYLPTNSFRSYWFTISVSNPDDKIQMHLLEIFKRNDCNVELSQIEFAVDFYPENKSDLFCLRHDLANSSVLRHSRLGSYREIGDYPKVTAYQGRNGNIRKGSKGFKCYIKSQKGCVRLELNANKGLLRTCLIRTSSLPVRASDINIFDYITFREVDDQSLYKLIVSCCKKRWPGYSKLTGSRRAMKVYIMESTIFDAFEKSKYGSPTSHWTHLKFIPMAECINITKKLKRDYGFTNHPYEYFPKNDRIANDINRCLRQ